MADEEYEMAEEEVDVSGGPTGYPEFESPQGFAPEEGVENDTEFEAIATLKRKPDGKLCLVALDGARFPDKQEDEVEEEEEITETVEGEGDSVSFADRLGMASKRMPG